MTDLYGHSACMDQEPSDWNPWAWRQDHVVLSGPTWPWNHPEGPQSMPVPDESVTVQSAIIEDSRSAYITLDTTYSKVVRKAVLHLCLQRPESRWDFESAFGDCWHLGLHSACETISRRAMLSPDCRIRSIGDLWMVLDRRCVKAEYDHIFDGPFIPELPDARPGEPIKLGLSRYYIPMEAICYTEEPVFNEPTQEWWNYDPLNILNLTKSLVSNLERFEAPTQVDNEFIRRFNDLPREIQDNIASLMDYGNISLKCTNLTPQSFWREALLQIPFLWDIEKDIITAKDQEAEEGGFEWSWEKLTRQVMAEFPMIQATPYNEEEDEWDEVPIPWSYRNVGLDVPPGFTNRRRIWQILSEMYPNDVGMIHCSDQDDIVG